MSGPHAHGPSDPRAALAALWGALRLAVIDIETCNGPNGDHIIELAVLTYRARRQVGTWVRRFHPGVPVDPRSQAVHGITDDDLARERPFAESIDELRRVLTPLDGERLVVVGHNPAFDVSRLQLELSRAGQPALPDVAVLDTAALARHLDLPKGSLADLLAALDLSNTGPHSAPGDADATARAIVLMLARAADRGTHDLDALIAQVMPARQARTALIRPAGKSRRTHQQNDDDPGAVTLPEEHIHGHAELLPDTPTPGELTAWTAQVAECQALRCPYLTDRVAAAPLPPEQLLAVLEPLLDHALTAADGPAAATLLGPLAPLLAHLPGRLAALRWHGTWSARLGGLRGCPSDDRCPACRDRQPCPLDTWQQPLAAAAVGDLGGGQSARSFLHTSGAGTGRGVFTSWHARKLGQLADYAAWLVHQHWVGDGQHDRAALVAHYAWAAGGRDPRLVAVHARNLAASGDLRRLSAARDVCDEAWLHRGSSTDDGWHQLRATRNRIAGQLNRRTVRPGGDTDTNGNPIPLRRHHPTQPERTRPGRFSLSR